MGTPSPFAIGLTTFIVCMAVLLYVVGPEACNDGWVSPSIGRQGACSWHGGVNDFPQVASFLVSLLVAFIASNLVSKRNGRKRNAAPSSIPPQVFQVGVHVYHPAFGRGRVMEMEGEGSDSKLLVNFGCGNKKLHLEIARNHGLRVINL
jgi:hypothetical protein